MLHTSLSIKGSPYGNDSQQSNTQSYTLTSKRRIQQHEFSYLTRVCNLLYNSPMPKESWKGTNKSGSLNKFIEVIAAEYTLGPVDQRVVSSAIESILKSGDVTRAKNLFEMRLKMKETVLDQKTTDKLINDAKEYRETYKDEIEQALAPVKKEIVNKDTSTTRIKSQDVTKTSSGVELEGTDNKKVNNDDAIDVPVVKEILITPVKSEAPKAENKTEARLRFEAREKLLLEIAEFLKQGVDRIVIHGQTIEKGDGVRVNPSFGKNIDTDTRAALLLLGLDKNIKYNTNSYTEMVKKGGKAGKQEEGVDYGKRKKQKNETILYIDTSGEKLSMKMNRNGVGKEIFLDHHQEYFSRYATSATELAFEIRKKLKEIETEGEKANSPEIAPWEGELAHLVTEIDNLTYVENPNFNERFLEKDWPKSMYALVKEVPFKKVAEWAKGGKFKEGEDIAFPKFTDAELDEFIEVRIIKDEKGKGVEKRCTLRDIIKMKEGEISIDISNAKFAVELQKARGIGTESGEIGKFIYNKQDRQTDIGILNKGRNKVNKIYNGFLTAKALGYDSYVTYNEEYKRFMVNNITVGDRINNVYRLGKKLQELVPKTVIVRGVMLFQPPGMSNRSNITENKFLKIIGAGEPKPIVKKIVTPNFDASESNNLDSATLEMLEQLKENEDKLNGSKEKLKELEAQKIELQDFVDNYKEESVIENESVVFTEQETAAIEGLKGKDLSQSLISPYTDIIQSETSTTQEKKGALRELSDQLTAKGTEVTVGMALGKEADLIYDLGHPVAEESDAIKALLQPQPESLDKSDLSEQKEPTNEQLESFNKKLEKVREHRKRLAATESDIEKLEMELFGKRLVIEEMVAEKEEESEEIKGGKETLRKFEEVLNQATPEQFESIIEALVGMLGSNNIKMELISPKLASYINIYKQIDASIVNAKDKKLSGIDRNNQVKMYVNLSKNLDTTKLKNGLTFINKKIDELKKVKI